MSARRIALVGVAVLAFGLSGCGKASKPARAIDARTYGTLAAWRSDVSGRYSKEAWAEFDAAMQELRLRAMEKGASGKDGIFAAVGEQIQGKTFEEALRLGYQAKRDRLRAMRDELKPMVDANALLIPKMGDDTVAAELKRRRSNQQGRLEQVLTDLSATERRLLELGGTTAPGATAGGAAHPADLPRDVALAEIELLMGSRRETSVLKYGGWPVAFDQTGMKLSGDDAVTYMERRQSAAKTGRTVMAVRSRNKWRVFDQEVALPNLSPSVLANLTDEDRKRVEQQWRALEAEIWARQMAHEESERGDPIPNEELLVPKPILEKPKVDL